MHREYIGTVTFDIECLKGQMQGHLIRSLISRKGAKLGHILLLNINRKPYKGSPMAPSL